MKRKIPSDAFEFYVSLGPSRSYQAVADHYDVTKRAVTQCATREGWAERLSKLEREAREKSDQKLGESMEEMRWSGPVSNTCWPAKAFNREDLPTPTRPKTAM